MFRIALAWLLCFALTLALFHASPAEAETAPASQAEFAAVMNDVKAPVSDHMPGHVVHCHCLLHIAAQAAADAIAVPASFIAAMPNAPTTSVPPRQAACPTSPLGPDPRR